MKSRLQGIGRYHTTLVLGGMSLFCILLSLIKVETTGSTRYLFLNWNLFLAAIPWLMSTLALLGKNTQRNTAVLCACAVVWLLFFPNAPYLLTDLFHLKKMESASAWFDLVLLLSFAWTGLLFRFQSLLDLQKITRNILSKRQSALLISGLLFVASFGVYLGRYLRWNSWDIVNNPLRLMGDIGDRFASPLAHPRTWAMTILLGALLNMMFWSIASLRSANEDR
jgi:uncharacterized membrane protein